MIVIVTDDPFTNIWPIASAIQVIPVSIHMINLYAVFILIIPCIVWLIRAPKSETKLDTPEIRYNQTVNVLDREGYYTFHINYTFQIHE